MISPPSSYMRLFIIILKDSKASIHSTFVEGGVLVEIVQSLLNDRQEMHARQSETNASSSTVFCQNKCNLRNLYKQAIPALTALHWFPASHQDLKLAWTTSFFFLPRRSILHPFFSFGSPGPSSTKITGTCKGCQLPMTGTFRQSFVFVTLADCS